MSKKVKVRVLKGSNLVVRDRRSSDPYVVLTLGNNEKRTKVVEKNLNPIWEEEFELPITDSCLKLKVWDRDHRWKLKKDDFMGEAQIDLHHLVHGDRDATKEKIVLPTSKENCFFRDSCITQYANGKRVQEVCLKLREVESGTVELQLECPA